MACKRNVMYQLFREIGASRRTAYFNRLRSRSRGASEAILQCVQAVKDFLKTPTQHDEELFFYAFPLRLRAHFWVNEKGKLPPDRRIPFEILLFELYKENKITAWMPNRLTCVASEEDFSVIMCMRRSTDLFDDITRPLVDTGKGSVAIFNSHTIPLIETLLGKERAKLFFTTCALLQNLPVLDFSRIYSFEYSLPLAVRVLLYLVLQDIEEFSLAEQLETNIQKAQRTRKEVLPPDERYPLGKLSVEQAVFAGALELGEDGIEELLYKTLQSKKIKPAVWHYIAPIFLSTGRGESIFTFWNALIRNEEWDVLLAHINEWGLMAFQLGIYALIENHVYSEDFALDLVHKILQLPIKDIENIHKVANLTVKTLLAISTLPELLKSEDPYTFYVGAWLSATTNYSGIWPETLMLENIGNETEDRYIVLGALCQLLEFEPFTYMVAWRALSLYPDSELIQALYIQFLVRVPRNLLEYTRWYEDIYRTDIVIPRMLEMLHLQYIVDDEEASRTIFNGLEKRIARMRSAESALTDNPLSKNEILKDNPEEPKYIPVPQLGVHVRDVFAPEVVWLMCNIAFLYTDLVPRVPDYDFYGSELAERIHSDLRKAQKR